MDIVLLDKLLQAYRDGSIDAGGLGQLNSMLDSKEGIEAFNLLLDKQLEDGSLDQNDFSNIYPQIQSSIDQQISQNRKRTRIIGIRWLTSAAAVLVAISAITILRLTQKESVLPENSVTRSEKTNKEILNKRENVILTIAGKQQVMLDSLSANNVALGAGSSLEKLSDGLVAYHPASVSPDSAVINTLTTPAGRQYSLVLPDGSRVWLNAMSSISFSSAFVQQQRTVNITGEVYFEVAAKANSPFVVHTRKEAITVLGTSFNIRDYDSEPYTRTTLVTGAVKIENKTLMPGQAYYHGHTTIANIDHDLAWKNGFFQFDNEEVSSILEELARWYGWTLHFEGTPPQLSFNGRIPRSTTEKAILDILRETGLHYRLEKNQLFIIP